MGTCQSAERPTQLFLLKFHWLELHQISASICTETCKMHIFSGCIDIAQVRPKSLPSSLERKRERMNLG